MVDKQVNLEKHCPQYIAKQQSPPHYLNLHNLPGPTWY